MATFSISLQFSNPFSEKIATAKNEGMRNTEPSCIEISGIGVSSLEIYKARYNRVRPREEIGWNQHY